MIKKTFSLLFLASPYCQNHPRHVEWLQRLDVFSNTENYNDIVLLLHTVWLCLLYRRASTFCHMHITKWYKWRLFIVSSVCVEYLRARPRFSVCFFSTAAPFFVSLLRLFWSGLWSVFFFRLWWEATALYIWQLENCNAVDAFEFDVLRLSVYYVGGFLS